MNRPDALLYSLAFYGYLLAFLGYIVYTAKDARRVGKFASALMTGGFIPHTAAFFVRWANQGHVPLANMYEYMGLMSWMCVAALLGFVRRYRNHNLGVFVSPLALMLLVVASLLPPDTNRQLMPALQSTWLAIHVTLAALGSGAFIVSFAAAVLFLLAHSKPQSKGRAGAFPWGDFLTFWMVLPAAVSLVAQLVGLVPPVLASVSSASGSTYTALALNLFGGEVQAGRPLIGLGMGMVVAAVIWPLVVRRRRDVPVPGAHIFVTIVLSVLFSSAVVGFLLKYNVVTLTPRSYFKIFEFLGLALTLSWVVALLLHPLLAGLGGWSERLGVTPQVLEELGYSAVLVGYPLYTVGALFAGAVWAEKAWGSWWSWDPKEVGALIIWLFYTGFLHARNQRNWRGTPAAVLLVLGVVMIFLSFFGNYFFGGLHSFEVG